jgi:hypothetical protein
MRYRLGILWASVLIFSPASGEEVKILRVLDWKPNHTKAEQAVFQAREEMAKVWVGDGGRDADLPQVDWDKETVIAVFDGAGNAVEIQVVEAYISLDETPGLEREERRADDPVFVTFRSVANAAVGVAVIGKTIGKFTFFDAASERGQRLEKARQRARKAEANLDALAKAMAEQLGKPTKADETLNEQQAKSIRDLFEPGARKDGK